MSSSQKSGSSGQDSKLNWMYQGPAALVNREDYLLGRSVDKSLKLLEEAEQGKRSFSYLDEAQKDLTPVSIFAPGPVVGAVDVIRKIKEDPLFQIQKKEEESLKQLLKNPIRVKKLREMAEKNKQSSSYDKSSSKSKKSKKKKKKRHASSSSSSSSSSDSDDDKNVDIDKLLTAKLASLQKNVVTSELTKKRKHDTDSNNNDSDNDDKKYKSNKYKTSASSTNNSSNRDYHHNNNNESRDRQYSTSKSKSHYSDRDRDYKRSDRSYSSSNNRNDREKTDRDRDSYSSSMRDDKYSKKNYPKTSSSTSSSSYRNKPEPVKKSVVDEAEKERRMKEMMENAKWREDLRNKNVKLYQTEQKNEEEKLKTDRDPDFIRKQLVEAANTGSVAKRIQSNSYNIQRSKSAMHTNFARR